MKFSFLNPTKIEFGQGQIASIKNNIPADSKVLVIYGGGSIKKNGVYEQVVAALAQHNWQEFSGVEPNPTAETLDKAVAIVKEQGIDFILAVGGGSVIDGSKYIAAAALYDGGAWDIMTGKHKVTKAVAIGAILTIPATGSESNGASVVTKAATHDKLAFMSPFVFPKFAVMDPEVMVTLPQRQLANGVVDAFVHVCEQYLTFPAGAMVQDGYAEALLKNLTVLAANFKHQDQAWRANLMWTANQALNGLIGAGVAQDWATHMIGHELTALYGVDHARSLAIIQPSLLRNQMEHKKAKLEQMGRNVFGLKQSDELAEQTIQAMEALYHSVDVATQLTEHGTDKNTAVEAILKQLTKHGLLKMGEHQAITLENSRVILEAAVA
ncbi:iron-containing alcohol dehydrogenase [Paraglaciecola sp. 25GB23A]|uniref:iron-containing alcohol dehydrogenase n=1 Tax=Paraglaciecola sp. 25GB23A TaxID=3156068 RepID=UPI0032AEF334